MANLITNINGRQTVRPAPTREEVEALTRAFRDRNEGDIIGYSEIEAVIGSRQTNRARTIIGRWKAAMLSIHNIHLQCVPTEGYLVAEPTTRVAHSARTVELANGRIMGAARVAAMTDRARLSDEDRRACDHIANMPARLNLAARVAPKKISLED